MSALPNRVVTLADIFRLLQSTRVVTSQISTYFAAITTPRGDTSACVAPRSGETCNHRVCGRAGRTCPSSRVARVAPLCLSALHSFFTGADWTAGWLLLLLLMLLLSPQWCRRRHVNDDIRAASLPWQTHTCALDHRVMTNDLHL